MGGKCDTLMLFRLRASSSLSRFKQVHLITLVTAESGRRSTISLLGGWLLWLVELSRCESCSLLKVLVQARGQVHEECVRLEEDSIATTRHDS